MKRLATILLVLLSSAALAQPKKKPPTPADPYAEPKPAPKKKPGKPEKGKPSDPYAEEPVEKPPVDPTPGPPKDVPAEAPPPEAKPEKQAKPEKDAKPEKKKPVDPYAAPEVTPSGPPPMPSKIAITDTTAIQGLLAVQRLDAWLLTDRDGENPIAKRIVMPDGNPSRPWFYTIPARGEAIAIVHEAEKRSFEHLPGKKLTYTSYKELDKQLKTMLKGMRSVALEYSARANMPSISRVDAGTLELIRGAGAKVRSSEALVQYTKAIWGEGGRTQHYVAAHHLVELRKDALAFVAKQLSANAAITELDVAQRLAKGMSMRGLVGSPPVVAAGANTADPYYVPTQAKNQPIRRGDVIVISLAAKVDKPDGVYAAQTWVAVADSTVREDVKKAFETAVLAREHAVSLITDRMRKTRPVTGAEVDQATRASIKKAGFGDRVMHRTGHSIDNDWQGSGADLDDFEVKDLRVLAMGCGVTVGPGIYFPGQFGVRSEVSVYLAPTGPEITTPAQDTIELLLR